jgi:hypothetical protein
MFLAALQAPRPGSLPADGHSARFEKTPGRSARGNLRRQGDGRSNALGEGAAASPMANRQLLPQYNFSAEMPVTTVAVHVEPRRLNES